MSDAQTSPTNRTSETSQLESRLGTFGGRIVHMAEELPETKPARHIRDQLTRAGTAPGAHYAEACSAQSHPDFTHKISLAAKEARESLYWLRVIRDAEWFDDGTLTSLIREADELVAMLFSSLKTARASAETSEEERLGRLGLATRDRWDRYECG
ncbi:MAG: four helix bundle protein [Bradymonadaceae bacterium]